MCALCSGSFDSQFKLSVCQLTCNLIFLLCRIGNAVFLLKWIKELIHDKSITVYFFYDIACVLDAHLRVCPIATRMSLYTVFLHSHCLSYLF